MKSPRQRFFIGDGTYVCWSADKTNFETEFAMIFDDPIAQDNPDLYSEKVKALLDSIKTGAFQADEGFQRFYVLGLSPGGGTRISVRFWDSRTISEYATNIQRYFDDLSIDKPKKYPKYFALNRLLVSVAQQGDKEKLPPKLAGEVVRSIICGIPYPESLLQASLRRIQSGIKKRLRDGRQITERVTPEIAALLKAYLNRYYQFYPIKDYREVYMSLDTNHTSIGYNLGRLFATLEHVQVKANPKINTTIRDRYFGAACTTPVTVFATLLRLKNHHLTKLNRGQFIFFEKLLNEIMEKISEFPPYLNLHEQGLFAIGYYHQRNKFFSNN